MNLKVKNTIIKFLIVIFVFSLALGILALIPPTPVSADDGEGNMTAVMLDSQEYPQYLNGLYRAAYGIKSTDIDTAGSSTNGGERGSYRFTNIFDGNKATFWISQNANTANEKISVTVNLNSEKTVYSILYGCSYYSRNGVRNFSGYPATLNVYTAVGDGEFRLSGTCVSEPEQDTEFALFTLPKAVNCDKIKIEFTEVLTYSGVFGGADVAAISDLAFYTVPEDIGLSAPVLAEGDYNNDNYLVTNSVSNNVMSCRANGGGDIGNAFDKNNRTYWSSVNYNTKIFKNKVTVIFDTVVELDSIVYACSYYSVGNKRNYSGFPRIMKVYTSETDNDLSLTAMFAGEPTGKWDKARFVFDGFVACKRMVIEFYDVTTYSEVEGGAPIAVAGELYLMQPADDGLAEILNIFSDYAQYELKPEYKDADKLNELREKAQHSGNYINTYKPILDRADAVCSGAIRKDAHREFSTAPGAKNRIEQTGDLASYARNVLKHSTFGTNRQVIGIGGTTGEKITVYVDAEDGDPLPQLAFTQIYGAWNSWMRTFSLKRGKNEITFPNFKAGGNYSRPVNAGGPIHVINPYVYGDTPNAASGIQSSNVKIYIEGGYLYPVFHDGDDEGTFRTILKDYYERLSDPNDTSITIDAFEAVTGNVMLSCTATLAYNSYILNGTSPQLNVDKWRDYIRQTLAFGGVEFDKSAPLYDVRNENVKVNYRIVQPYAGMYAFAASEHIGIIDAPTFGTMVQKWSTGWAMAHELGHMLDNRNMKIPEVTNNMWAIYTIYMINGSFNDRINVTNVSRNLASDFGAKVGNYYGNGNSNCDFWWIIEGGHPGYWAKLQQLYSRETSGNALANTTERLAYYSSLATGTDMSEYFERWGFTFSGARFTYADSSQTYKDMIAAAKSAGMVGEAKKYWYVNNNHYKAIREHGGKITADWGACYSSGQVVNVSSVTATGSGYSLRLPAPVNSDAHLCYEIQGYINGKWQVLGITYGTEYSDAYPYADGVVPKYRVVAYDRMFNTTGFSSEYVPEENTQTDVCRIGDIRYDSLNAAVQAAVAGDTIYLLKDCKEGGVAFNKQLTVLPDPDVFSQAQSVTITRGASGHMFSISANVTFGSAAGNVPTSAKIILDGDGYTQSGSLMYINACTVILNNVTLQNNFNSGNGGGLYVEYSAAVYVNGCAVQNNRGNNGGGIFINGRSAMSVRGLQLINNEAAGNGGGLYISQYTGNSFFHNRDKVNNAYPEIVISGNSAAGNGGGIFANNNVELYGVKILNNTGKYGGAIYNDIDNNGRYCRLTNCTLKDNTADIGDLVYINRGKVQVSGGELHGNIYKKFGDKSYPSKLGLMNAMPDFSRTAFELSVNITDEGAVLFDEVTGLKGDAIAGDVEAMSVKYGRAEFVSGVGIVAYPQKARIVINYAGGSFVTEMNYGVFALPDRLENLPETKYIENYIIGGKTFNIGDTFEISGDFNAEAVVKDYYLVTLEYGTYTEVHKVKQGENFYLPMRTNAGEVIFGWEDEAGNYYAYADGVKISSDLKLTAVIKMRLKVTFDVGGNISEYMYDIGETVMLPKPDAANGMIFKYWLIDGIKYNAGSSVTVNSTVNAVAEFAESWRVTTVIDDSEETAYYEHNSIIVLPRPEQSLGRTFGYWLVNGVKYYADAEYVVSGDTEFVAVFVQTENDERITVEFISNRGADESGDIVENDRQELTVSFLQEIILPEPVVNAGYVFRYWEINGSRYNAGDKITVTEAFTATAVVLPAEEVENEETQFTVTVVTVVDGNEQTSRFKYGKGENYYLKKPASAPEGKEFSHWLVDGTVYNSGSYVQINSDRAIKAVYKDISSPENPDGDGNSPEEADKNGKGGANAGLIAGVVIAVVAVGGGAAAVTIILIRRKKLNS